MKNEKLKLLQPYIGSWKTEGKTVDGDIICGTDVYEWLTGGFFLSHKVDVSMGKEKVNSLEITYYDDMDDVFRSQSFDHDGNISISTLRIIDDIILIFADNQRFQGHFKAGIIEGTWEQFDGQEWQLWMNIMLTKQKEPAAIKNHMEQVNEINNN